MSPCFAHIRITLLILVCKSIVTIGQLENDDWIDPYDMLNYDASTKTMRKPTEPSNYDNVPTKRREHIGLQDSTQMDLAECHKKVDGLQGEIKAHMKKLESLVQQPTCNPVFKRFLTKLLKEIERVGLPSDFSTDVYYDAKVSLSRHGVAEIRKLLEGEDSWRTGALDDAVSRILVDLKPHDYEAWRWHFEDTFGVEVDTIFKMCICILILVAIISCEMWSNVSWFVQFRRSFAICFFISIVWNWFYLYKIAFAEHQNNMVKMDSVNDKCTGVKKIDWSDSLKEWFRSTWTLQDDPCKKYYEVLMVNPILLVPPTKAISVTITTFITEPMKHVGKGISEFLVALLKDLPFTLQLPVLLTIVLSILVFMYGSVQAAFQYGIMAPLRGGGRGPPPPAVEEHEPEPLRLRGADYLAGGDAPQYDPVPRGPVIQGRPNNNNLQQRRPNMAKERPARVSVETLRNADRTSSEDEIDSESQRIPDLEQPVAVLDNGPLSGGDTEVQEPLAGAEAGGAAAPEDQAVSELSKDNATPKPSSAGNNNSSQVKAEPNSGDSAPAESITEMEPTPAAQQGNVPVLEATAEERANSMQRIETLGTPVQETGPSSQVALE